MLKVGAQSTVHPRSVNFDSSIQVWNAATRSEAVEISWESTHPIKALSQV